jgi:hypothetical protein
MKLFGPTYDLEPGHMARSIPGNTILASRSIASVFMFYVRFSWI